MTAVFLSLNNFINAKLKQAMNEFENRMNALRRQFRAERVSITKDACRRIGHINYDISKARFPEVRDALRAEKERIYEEMRQSHRYSRLCYRQQLQALEDEYQQHRERNPSKSRIRRMVAAICAAAEAQGEKSLSIAFGDNRHATITFP